MVMAIKSKIIFQINNKTKYDNTVYKIEFKNSQ